MIYGRKMSGNFSRTDIENLEMRDGESVIKYGKTCVFAPHPDDESLGCGGLIALLRKFDLAVDVIVLSDGTLSHPNSRKFPSEKLRDLRETEMKNALRILGVSEDKITFLGYRDRSVPQSGTDDFAAAVLKIKNLLVKINPQTIVVPWRRDPHPDHRAAWQIVHSAVNSADIFDRKIKILEYPIWLWELAEDNDLPLKDEIKAWRLNIETVAEQKQNAIKAHVSQITDLIDDDPEGFRLSPEVLRYFAVPYEVFLEEI